MAVIPKTYFVFNEGDTIRVPFRVYNDGTSAVTNGTLTFNAFPAGVTFVRAYHEVGTYTALSRTWTIPSLPAGRVETIYLEFTIDVLGDNVYSIDGGSLLILNADYPGENEDYFEVLVTKHPVGLTFQGFDSKESLSIRSNANGTYPISDSESGITNVLVSATNNVTYTLPASASVDDGFSAILKVIDDGTHVIKLDADGTDTIEGDAGVTLTSGEYIEVVLCKSCSPAIWFVKSNFTF